ncbi:MAG: NAD(+) synthase [Mycoplasma sp.]|nr:NAD(+) synthase [Mycoplasma sp.]
MKKYLEYLVNWLQEEVSKANAKGVIVGLSGGVDSSVVATLAKKAFPNNSLGVFIPCGDMGQDLIDAKEVSRAIKIETITIDITESFEAMKKAVNVKKRMSIANIKPRLRMSSLYAVAQEKNYLVLGTDNAAEWILGYFTKYGDGGVDLLPIIHLTKSEVILSAKELNLPKAVWIKKPTAALWEGQTDEEELGFKYSDVDKYLNGESVNETIKTKIEKQIKSTEHKRLPVPKPIKKTSI